MVTQIPISVAALVRDGLVLLVHCHPSRRWSPDCWDLVGGHVESGELPHQAVSRECLEELGVHVQDPLPTPMTVGTRGHHSFGAADASASAAMGVLEVVVHTHDLAAGLGVAWEPDRDLWARVLARLMPEVPRTADAWADLLWACGRIELDGRGRRPDGWRWQN